MLNFMKKILDKFTKKKKDVILEDVANEKLDITPGKPVIPGDGSTFKQVIGIIAENELPEERYFENKKVVKVATTIVNDKEYTEITTIDGCVYLDPIA